MTYFVSTYPRFRNNLTFDDFLLLFLFLSPFLPSFSFFFSGRDWLEAGHKDKAKWKGKEKY